MRGFLRVVVVCVALLGSGCGVRSAETVAVQAGVVDANGVSIAYESFGPADRETVLLIAGFASQMTMWPDELCHELVRRGYRVVRFDNRDVGLSTHLDHLGQPDWQAIQTAYDAGQQLPVPYTLADMASDAVGLLDGLGVEAAHIVGGSMGAAIAQLVALDYPERTRSLTSISGDTGNPETPGPTAQVLALPPSPPAGSDVETIVAHEVAVWDVLGSPAYPTDEDVLRERIRREVERSYDPDDLERQSAAILATGDRRERLRLLDVPTVVLHGDADLVVPVENGRDTAASILAPSWSSSREWGTTCHSSSSRRSPTRSPEPPPAVRRGRRCVDIGAAPVTRKPFDIGQGRVPSYLV